MCLFYLFDFLLLLLLSDKNDKFTIEKYDSFILLLRNVTVLLYC